MRATLDGTKVLLLLFLPRAAGDQHRGKYRKKEIGQQGRLIFCVKT